MGLLKESAKFEWHGVKCAKCHSKETIKIPLGTIMTSGRFTKDHEYVCSPCKKKKK